MDLLGRTCNTERMNTARLIARAFVLAGGIIWAFMFFASGTAARYSNLTYTFSEVVNAGVSALVPLVLTVGVFVLAMYYERLAALVLALAALAAVVWGVAAGWNEALIWTSMVVAVILPLIISAALFMVASNTQRACELESA
jgi:membrane-bound metal-dependent hydrolase YbcI (DUF457 family)